MASTELKRTFSAGDRKTWTFSAWIKLTGFSGTGFFAAYASGTNRSYFGINGANQLLLYAQQSGADTCSVNSTQKLRDSGAWYHLVCTCDTTQSTGTDRVKFYVNGTQADVSFNHTPDQDEDLYINSAVEHAIGSRDDGSTYFDGCMTHVHFTDGYAYAASDFGETDSTSGIWKPKTNPSVTYGTNGFFLKFANSASLGLDSSGNSNNFTVSGTGTQTQDTPSNNFATWNSLSNPRIISGTAYNPTFSNGNTTANHADTNYYTGTKSSLGVSSGKWYTEVKCSAVGTQSFIGLASDDDYGEIADTYTYRNNGTVNGSAYGNTFTTGDIIQIAFDADNGTVWFGKNGTWENSATQTEIENGTTTNAAVSGLSMTKFYHFATKGYNGSFIQLNAGNGRFGTTALASSNSDSAGLGLFEYSVPSGYYALCTKNIKNYG